MDLCVYVLCTLLYIVEVLQIGQGCLLHWHILYVPTQIQEFGCPPKVKYNVCHLCAIFITFLVQPVLCFCAHFSLFNLIGANNKINSPYLLSKWNI